MSRPIKSDGGSSNYYDIPIPPWLFERLVERAESGECFIKTEELIECGFGDDFDFGNSLKSLVRAWGAFNGAGKEGNSVGYELNKIRYSIGKIEDRYWRQVGSP